MRFPESRSFSNRLFLRSDFFHCVFQAQAIELIHWQVAKQIDSPGIYESCATDCSAAQHPTIVMGSLLGVAIG